MVANRFTGTGVSTSLATKRETGAAYVECLLAELKMPPVDAWLQEATSKGDDALRVGVAAMLTQMERKVLSDEPWRNGPWKGADTERTIKMSHFNELMYALRALLNNSRAHHGRVNLLSNSWFGEISAYKSLKKAMVAKFASAAKELGKELEQKRELTLTDMQRIDLYRSMLSLSVRSDQLSTKARPDSARKLFITLTLCLIVTTYLGLGARGVNIDTLVWGGLKLVRWNTSHQWEMFRPTMLQISTGFKGGGAGSVSLDEILPHRDVMQCSISMLGLYFLYILIILMDPFPSVAEWVKTGHCVPFLRGQKLSVQPGALSVTSFNDTFREELESIGADTALTLHSLRNLRIADAGTDHGLSRPDIQHGAGHTSGSHAVSYHARDAKWTLSGAGYRGSDPEMLAPQVRLLELYLVGEEHSDDAEELLRIAFASRLSDWTTLCDDASASNDEQGSKAQRWIEVVKHSVLSFLVGCAFRPRDRFGFIDMDSPIKQRLLGSELVSDARFVAIFESDAYARLLERARLYEQTELDVGELANVGQAERRERAQMSGMEARLSSQLSSIPAEVAASVAPALDEEAQLRLDGEWLQHHNSDRIRCFGSTSSLDQFSPCNLKPGDPRLRQMRQEEEEKDRKRAREQTSIDQWFGPPRGIIRMSTGCDLCRAAGIPSSALCPHAQQQQRLDPPSAPPPEPKGESEEPLQRKVAELEEQLRAAKEEIARLRSAPPAKEEADSVATVPQINELRSVQHLLTVYVNLVGPLEMDTSWRLSPNVSKEEAGRRLRLVGAYVNVVQVVLSECAVADYSDFWESGLRVEQRRLAGSTFTKIAKQAHTIETETRARISQRLKETAFLGFLKPLLKETTPAAALPAVPPAVTVEAVASSSSDPLTQFYVSFDPSTSTGVARFTVRDGALVGVKLGLLRLPSSGSSGVRCLHLFEALSAWVSGATRGFVEPYYAHASAARGTALNYEIRSAIQMALARASVEYGEIVDKTWKKAVAKKADASKQEARAAVEKILSISLPPSVNHDTSDALCIGVCGLIGLGVRVQEGGVALELTT